MIAEWVIQAALTVFLIVFLVQVEALYTALYLSACIFIITTYGLEIRVAKPYDLFRLWITTSACVLVLNYLSSLFTRKATSGVDEA